MMMKNILVLAFNDLAIAFKNKTFFLILFIPLFVFVSLNLVDRPDAESGKVKIGLIQNYAYAPEITRSLKAADKLIDVTWIKDEMEGIRLLKEHKIDGILSKNEKISDSLSLLVIKKDSLQTLVIVQNISALQKAAEGELKGILAYTSDPVVSTDMLHNSNSSIVDSDLTKVIGGNLAKVVAWYDNEWGYSCRVVDLIDFLGKKGL